MKGKDAKIPEGYTGVILGKANAGNEVAEETTKQMERDGGELGGEEGEEGEGFEEAQALEEVASFDKIVLWGHESLVEGDDPFVKGVEEWIGFAEAVSPCRSGAKGRRNCADGETWTDA